MKNNMKKLLYVYTYILILVLSFSLLGCRTAAPNMDSIGSTDEQIAGDYLIELNEQNKVIIKLPSTYQQSKVIGNEMAEHISRILQNMTGTEFALTHTQEAPEVDSNWFLDGYSEYAISLESRVTLCNDEIVSVIFEGMLNYRSAAHPVHLFFTLNYDPKTNKEISVTDVYDVSNELYDLVIQSIQQKATTEDSQKWAAIENYFLTTHASQEDFRSGMSKFNYYFTDSGIGISFPVPYAIGSHAEVEIEMH